ncbi:MAG: DNA polymerase Y family protein [Flavobacteriaceae bacterium]
MLALFLPRLPTDRITRLRRARTRNRDASSPSAAPPEEAPLAIIRSERNALRIAALDERAARAGLRTGVALSDARAMLPGLDCVEEDEAADRALLEGIARWAGRYTPLVALDGRDGLFLDITGCAHLFGGEAALLDDLQTRLGAQGFAARGAIADTPGAAWAVARHGGGCVVPPGRHREALQDLPLAALRIDAELVPALMRMGFRSIGCIAFLPRGPLAARFGAGLLRRIDQALGREGEPLSPLSPPPLLSVEKRFAEPVVHADDVHRSITLLAARLSVMLEKRRLGLRHCGLSLFRVDGEVISLDVHAADPSRDPARIAALFDERIAGLASGIDAGYGFDIVRLDALHAETLADEQARLDAGPSRHDRFTLLVERLNARLGAASVREYAFADTHIPERRFGLLPVIRESRGEGEGEGEGEAKPMPGEITRPLLLLDPPERIEAVAEVPEGPPSRFRWRRARYDIRRSEGPERIACEWWRDGRGAFSRDYFRVEDVEGHRFWVFRHGLYGRETDRPHWYLHGLFA